MGTFAAGQIVILPFPFSDLTARKYRPALLLAAVGKGDWIVCQITSNAYGDQHAVALRDKDFSAGGLRRESFVRPGKLFTAHENLFSDVAGALTHTYLGSLRQAVVEMILGGTRI